ncbi:hypothetical protein G6F58_013631 [Rhizopus delemar]|nr:hypothetical protein G6F58_013631 [Rhizopus delemar]
MSATMTVAPWPATPCAMVAPRPRPAPVTRTRLSLMDVMVCPSRRVMRPDRRAARLRRWQAWRIRPPARFRRSSPCRRCADGLR